MGVLNLIFKKSELTLGLAEKNQALQSKGNGTWGCGCGL